MAVVVTGDSILVLLPGEMKRRCALATSMAEPIMWPGISRARAARVRAPDARELLDGFTPEDRVKEHSP